MVCAVGLICEAIRRRLAENGINLVGTPYCGNYGVTFNDLYTLCEAYAKTNNATGIELGRDYRLGLIDDYHLRRSFVQCDA